MSLLSVAGSGLRSQTQSLDAISNNIANMNTTGYETAGVSFADSLTQVYGQAPATQGLPNRQSPIGLWLGTGGYAMPGVRSFAAGNYVTTRNPLDMAIQGDGFFTLALPGGATGYTRAGAFVASNDPQTGQMYLTTPNGARVLSVNGKPIDLTGVDLATVHVSPNGVLTADTTAGQPRRIGQLALAYVAHPGSALASLGANVYQLKPGFVAASNAAGAPPVLSAIGQVHGGMLEMSNVNLTNQMTNMIQAQQQYQIAAKAVSIADQMMGLATTIK
ncbi:MAG: flagellar hook-basal body protein [Bacilli bacterium]